MHPLPLWVHPAMLIAPVAVVVHVAFAVVAVGPHPCCAMPLQLRGAHVVATAGPKNQEFLKVILDSVKRVTAAHHSDKTVL